ncbi:MAG: trimethylamine methyltransferase family protein [Anaerolineae bacterium]|jgi:trimethylamine--corrinoid protein Co-methyltransferase
MLQPSLVENRSVSFRVLSEDQIWELRQTAFDILEKAGCRVMHKGALDLLRAAGAIVKDERVWVPRHIVEECVRTTPKGFVIYNRGGRRAMEVEGRKSYYGTSTASPNTRDVHTGQFRETRVADIALGAKVADALPNIDWVMPMGSSQDVHPLAADLYEFEAVVSNTTKPLAFIGYSPRGVELVYEMAAEVAGGLDNLRQHPFLLAYPEPISPFVFPGEVVERMFIAADLFMPQIPGSTVQPGATAPVTMAGAVAQLIAEGLMGLVLVQLRKPGAPCCLSGNFGILDMRSALMTMAAPEMSLGLAAQAEVAQSFGLPTWGLAGATDAKVLDAQAGIEGAFSILAQGLAGLNLIHDVGYMDAGMACSAEMLVMGDEVIGMAKRFIRGIEVRSETLARALVERIGPGGNFLQERHTVRHFRNELWVPGLLTREHRDIWQQAGGKDMAQRVQEKAQETIENHQPEPLPDEVATALAEIRQRGEEELAGSDNPGEAG